MKKMDPINAVKLKIEKANAIKRCRRLRKIAALFRVIEVFFILIVISRFSVKIPFTINFSGEYIRQIYSAVFSSRFVFIIGNAIVITLFLKSDWNSNSNESSAKFYAEYVENRVKQSREKEFVVERRIRRSKSEDLEKVGGEVPRRELQRSATDTRRKILQDLPEVEEKMSGEEFRRRVEAFIARQRGSLREEFSAIASNCA